MKRIHKIILARLALFAVLALSGCISLTPIDLTGGWAGTLVWTSGPFPGITSTISLELVHENRDLAGTVTLMGPGSQPFGISITDGRTQARSLRLEASGTMTLLTPFVSVSLTLEGDFDETAMSGTGTQKNDGQEYTFTWEAVRISGPPEE